MGIVSSIINILFEVWFVYYNIIKIKNIKNKKVVFYISLLISYILSSILIGFAYKNQIYMLVINSILNFIIMKVLYNKINITDLFLTYYLVSLILFITIITTLVFGYNIGMLLINRVILLLLALYLHKLIDKMYKIYIKNWNRGKNNKVKSVTIRSTTIIIANFILFLVNNYILFYLLEIIKK